MCCCQFNSTHFFTDRSEFIEHLYSRHPSSYVASKFYDQELKMSHFLVFNKLVRNPFMDVEKVKEFYCWENRVFDDLKICGCVLVKDRKNLLPGAITFNNQAFISHCRTHTDEKFENCSHRYNERP